MSDRTQQQPYTYYAFISYKRVDGKWAAWLQHKLQSYRLPTRLYKQYRTLPKRLTPIFLDKENLTSGELEKSLENELAASRYLIVICSRAAHDLPYYLDKEIRAFLNAGHTPDQIIPFIVEKSSKPEEECFPPALQEVCQEHNLLGINIHDSSGRNAFLKVVAYMHGLKLTEVESAEDKRLRRNRLIAFFCSLLLLLCLSYAGYRLWEYYVPKVGYYLDYTTAFGIPVGIHPLDEEDILHMQEHYTLITLGNRRYELRHENSLGNLIEESLTEHLDRPIHAVYECPTDGKISTVTYYDRNGTPLKFMKYDDESTSQYRQTVEIRQSGTDFATNSHLDSASMSMSRNSPDAEMINGQGKSDITRYLINYTEEGYVSMMRYADHSNRAISDYEGVWGLAYERDSLGRPLTMYYLTYNGVSKDATVGEDYSHKASGYCGRKYEYDDLDRMQEVTYFGPNEEPMKNEQGWMICKLSYNDPFSPYNASQESYFDADGMPLPIKDTSVVKMVYTHDQNGFTTSRKYYDAEGQSAFYEGRVIDEWLYDEHGFLTEIRCYDANMDLTAAQGDICVWKYTLDSNGNLLHQATLGKDYKPVANAEGIAQAVYEYDAQWHLTKVAYLDENGEVATDPFGIAGMKYEYNKQGLMETAIRLGPDGQPLMCKDGYAAWRNAYSLSGNLIQTTLLDENMKICISNDGLSVAKYDYDSSGREIRSSSYDMADKLVNTVDHYAVVEYTYDDNGKIIGYAYYDAQNKLVNTSEGYARETLFYDEYLQLVWDEYYDANSNLVIGPDGYAFSIRERDVNGNILQQSYYGPDKELLTLEPEGYAYYQNQYEGRNCVQTISYDKQGNMVAKGLLNEPDVAERWIYYQAYDKEGSLINGADGYAYMIFEYDENDNLIRDSYYNAHNSPVICQYGYAVSVREWDRNGNMIRQSCYGTDEELITQIAGYAIWEALYEGNELIEEKYFDTQHHLLATGVWYKNSNITQVTYYVAYDQQGNLIDSPPAYAYEQIDFDENDNMIKDAYYNAQNDLVIGPEGYAVCVQEWDANGQMIRQLCYDPERNLCKRNDGYAIWEGYYKGEICIQEEFFDEHANLMMSSFRNETGLIIKEIYYEAYDESGTLINTPKGYAFIIAEWDADDTLIRLDYYDAAGNLIEN